MWHILAHQISSVDALFVLSFSQQHNLMNSSAQKSSGVHWCRSRVRFNEVPEKVPKGPEKVWEALVQSQVTFNRVPEKVPEEVWEALVQSQVRFNRAKVPEKVPGSLGAKPSQVQQGFGEGSGKGSGEGSGEGREALVPGQVQKGSGEGSGEGGEALVQQGCREGSGEGWGGFGAEPGQVRQGSGEGSGRLWCRARSGSTGFWRRCRRRFREALVQSQIRFNRVPENVPEKVPGGFGAEPGQGQQGSGEGFGEGSGEGSGRLWCRARSGSTGFWRRFRRRFREALAQSHVGFNRVPEKAPEKVWEALMQSQVNRICGHLTHGNPAEVFPALGLAKRFRNICKNKALRLLRIPPKLIFLIAISIHQDSCGENFGEALRAC